MRGRSQSMNLHPNPGRKHVASVFAAVISISLALLAATSISGCKRKAPTASDASATSPATPAAQAPVAPTPIQPPVITKTYTGILKGNIAAIGGESTGWALLYIDELENASLEVAVDAVADRARALEGKRVIVTGTVFKARLVERGEVDRIRVKSIEEHPEQPAKTVPPGTVGLPTFVVHPPKPPSRKIAVGSADFTGVLQEVAAVGEKGGGLVLKCEQMRGADIRLDEGLVSAKLRELVGKRVRLSGDMRDSEFVHADGRRETVKMIWVTGVDEAK